MEVLALQVFVSLALVAGSILLFAFTCHQRTFDHADRLALLPMDDDANARPRASSVPRESPSPPADAARARNACANSDAAG